MKLLPWCVVVVLLASAASAQDVPETLSAAAGKLGVEFKAASPGVFRTSLTHGLKTCDRIDLEIRTGENGSAEVVAYPRVNGERLEPRRSADKEMLLAKLGEPCGAITPLAWGTDGVLPVHAAFAAKPDEIEQALLASPALDAQVEDLLPMLKSALTDEQVKERLEAAGAETDEAKRNAILKEIVAYLPEIEPAEPGQATFEPLTMNRAGVAFDAFRFRVPGEDERRLAWAFAYPPGTAKGWFIAPMDGDAQKFVKFHRGGKYEGVPADYAVLLQRSETPLKTGGEYVLWFQFKVDSPVEIKVSLTCVPYNTADRDQPAVIEEALGLKAD